MYMCTVACTFAVVDVAASRGSERQAATVNRRDDEPGPALEASGGGRPTGNAEAQQCGCGRFGDNNARRQRGLWSGREEPNLHRGAHSIAKPALLAFAPGLCGPEVAHREFDVDTTFALSKEVFPDNQKVNQRVGWIAAGGHSRDRPKERHVEVVSSLLRTLRARAANLRRRLRLLSDAARLLGADQDGPERPSCHPNRHLAARDDKGFHRRDRWQTSRQHHPDHWRAQRVPLAR